MTRSGQADDPLEEVLGNVSVVLAGVTHPGNIGSCARAMKTMGVGDMRLAAPVARIDESSHANAASATDILDRSPAFPDALAALADCGHAVALTARRRHLSLPMLPLPEAMALLAQRAGAGARVALLLGNEKAGLSNQEALLANCLAEIPASPRYPSLNIAQALQVALYELRRQAGLAHERPPPGDARELPTVAHREQMFDHLDRVAHALGIVGDHDKRPFLVRMRRLLMRADPDLQETNLLRGFLSAIDRKIGR